jgi:hypothetical protein
MRIVTISTLLAAVFLLTSCSYTTDFVVINESDHPAEIRYKVKDFPGPFGPPVTPATITASQLNTHGAQQWKILTSDQYQLDQGNRTVTVRLEQDEALRVARMHKYGGRQDPQDAKDFPIEEIAITGEVGEIPLKGQQARIAFSNVSRALYTLTYK